MLFALLAAICDFFLEEDEDLLSSRAAVGAWRPSKAGCLQLRRSIEQMQGSSEDLVLNKKVLLSLLFEDAANSQERFIGEHKKQHELFVAEAFFVFIENYLEG